VAAAGHHEKVISTGEQRLNAGLHPSRPPPLPGYQSVEAASLGRHKGHRATAVARSHCNTPVGKKAGRPRASRRRSIWRCYDAAGVALLSSCRCGGCGGGKLMSHVVSTTWQAVSVP